MVGVCSAPRHPRPRAVTVVVVVAALMAVACGGGARGGATASDGPAGIAISPSLQVASVTLPDVSKGGEAFRMVAPRGDILLTYFGYTSCPDICPTTLADIRSALRQLGSEASRVELAMITVDPRRDTPDVLTRYVQSFVKSAHALRSDDDAVLTAAAHAFGVHYEIDVKADGTEDVGHSSLVSAVDDTGRVRLQWTFGTPVSDLVHDFKLLLSGAA